MMEPFENIGRLAFEDLERLASACPVLDHLELPKLADDDDVPSLISRDTLDLHIKGIGVAFAHETMVTVRAVTPKGDQLVSSLANEDPSMTNSRSAIVLALPRRIISVPASLHAKSGFHNRRHNASNQ
jgi:phage FluMu protein gp41